LQPLPCKLIGETGWASAGTGAGNGGKTVTGNPQDTARYHKEVLQKAKEQGVKLFYFEALDEPWKGQNDPNNFNSNWGVWHWDGSEPVPKDGMLD
jgi:exo-beta-1,3-glucanase (GH17 family)